MKKLHYLNPIPFDPYLCGTEPIEDVEPITWTYKFEGRIIWSTALIELFETCYYEN